MLLLSAVSPVCAWVAWSDLTRMTIPNRAVVALLVVFLLVGPFMLPWQEYAWRWAHVAVVLAIGFALTLARLIGAGDAKFLAAMAAFVDRHDAASFLLLTAAVLLVAFAAHRMARACPAVRRRLPHWESWSRREFPMGLALGFALPLYLAIPLTMA